MTKKIVMFGAQWCSDCRRSQKVLDELAVDYEYVDLEKDPAAADLAHDISGRTNIPVIAFSDGTHMVEPGDAELRAKVLSLE